MKKQKLKAALGFFAAGVVNGLFGAGGGMLAVPLLKSLDFEQKDAHANSIAIILPLSVVSAILYAINGQIQLDKTLPFIPFGIVGAVCGTLLMRHISPKWLKRIFACFMIWAGVRMFL